MRGRERERERVREREGEREREREREVKKWNASWADALQQGFSTQLLVSFSKIWKMFKTNKLRKVLARFYEIK